ncbi:MAG: isoprenylcysteine carboxylmethyltransferase family protein [Bacteroidetes bacterium]|nr:MAG: isoprenylcysteine carboxylmethyltransferase family protein [Bacteroidota bacterium]
MRVFFILTLFSRRAMLRKILIIKHIEHIEIVCFGSETATRADSYFSPESVYFSTPIIRTSPSMHLLLACWALYYFLHSLLAAQSLKRAFAAAFPEFNRYYRLIYNLLAAGGLLLLIAAQLRVTSAQILPEGMLGQGLGLLFVLAGGLLGAASLARYDMGEFTGIRQARAAQTQTSVLVTTGLNGVVRHPLYFATLLALAGFVLYRGQWADLLFALLSAVYIYIGAVLEERKLEVTFGESYRTYKQKVSMLIPYII